MIPPSRSFPYYAKLLLASALFPLSFAPVSSCLKVPRLGFPEGLVLPTKRDISSGLPNSPLYVEMPIDHWSGNATYNNRYWVNDTYYESGGPVFIFDSGEQNAEPLLPYYLQAGTTADQWKYLTTEQALEDVVYFANSFANMAHPTASTSFFSSDFTSLPLHPSITPRIWLGGSYPGIRGALLRQRNPEIIYAAWASSAPVQAQVDMSSYYKAAERSLTRNCSADWVAVMRYVDGVFQGTNQTLIAEVKYELLKAELSGPGGNSTAAANLTITQAQKVSDVTAVRILMDPLDFYQYYGFQDSVLPFCNLLETQNYTAAPIETGLDAAYGVGVAFRAFLTGISELDYNDIPVADDPIQDMSWMYQYCSEYGFYQRGDPDNSLSIETSFLSLDYFQQGCDTTFPGSFSSPPAVEHVNKYGGWNMTPSNAMFTNGEFDPWRTMGLASIESNAPHRNSTVSVPACNTPSPRTSFFGLMHANMVHVSDMRVLITPDENHTDFKTVGFYSPISQEPFYSGLGLFQMALDEWLPCFGQNFGKQEPLRL